MSAPAGPIAGLGFRQELLKVAMAGPIGGSFGFFYGLMLRIAYEQVYPLLFPATGKKVDMNRLVDVIKATDVVTRQVGSRGATDFGLQLGLENAAKQFGIPLEQLINTGLPDISTSSIRSDNSAYKAIEDFFGQITSTLAQAGQTQYAHAQQPVVTPQPSQPVNTLTGEFHNTGFEKLSDPEVFKANREISAGTWIFQGNPQLVQAMKDEQSRRRDKIREGKEVVQEGRSPFSDPVQERAITPIEQEFNNWRSQDVSKITALIQAKKRIADYSSRRFKEAAARFQNRKNLIRQQKSYNNQVVAYYNWLQGGRNSSNHQIKRQANRQWTQRSFRTVQVTKLY